MSLSQKVEAAIIEALAELEPALTVTPGTAKTHRVISVMGWNSSTATKLAIAKYLVGLRICAVQMAFRIRADLSNTPERRAEVVKNVEAIVGKDATGLTQEVIERMRNPWIAEGLWHLCLYLSQKVATIHPAGKLVAITLPHVDATDHGLDVAALYQDTNGAFGLSIVETKAYPDRPNAAIRDAVKFYKGVDKEVFSLKIRQAIQLMRSHLSAEVQPSISEELWLQARSYLPNPHYDAGKAVNWRNTRPSFKSLKLPAERIFVMPHSAPNFDQFFDEIAVEMLKFAKTL